MSATREVTAGGWRVRLDPSRQVLRLEVPETAGRPPLSPVLPPGEDGPSSAATLLLKAKRFDDRLFAAVELAAQRGKATLLRSLAATLADGPADAATVIHAACVLGGLAGPASEAARAAAADFLADEALSTPLGFYGWTPELSAIFRQDRFLQRPLAPGTADRLAQAVRHTPGAAEAHDACLRLNAGLTNPPKGLGVRDAGRRPGFLPPSRSHEVTLFERLYEDRPVPEGFDLMGELIRRVRSGDVRLEPADDAGWYDRQTWSLEPLLLPERMPERARLELGRRYRRQLEDLFRGAMALTRETHIKQGGGGAGGYAGPRRPPIWVGPGLSVEPLPTLYARRADCYRFVRSVLEGTFGADALGRMRLISPEGADAGGLAEGLDRVERLFAGASAAAARDLGMPHDDQAARGFSDWRADAGSDPDVSGDARAMVPVFYDVQRKKMKVWALLGWRTTGVQADYRVPPAVLAVEPLAGEPPGDPPPVLFRADWYEFAVPVTAEVYVTRLLGRDAFRRHCDRHRTRDAILANLA
ncbi:MAG: hypothetical protein ACRC33_18745 [Gemmataceae bacterium]